MSLWDFFNSKIDPARPIGLGREKVAEVAANKEEYYRTMKRFAIEAGDAESVRYYNDKLDALKVLQYELDVLSSMPGDPSDPNEAAPGNEEE